MSVLLSSDLSDGSAIPYFTWDEPMTVSQFRQKLVSASPEERSRLLGKLLREAKDTDVWKFTSPSEIAKEWNSIVRHLGRRREFWKFHIDFWTKEGLIG